MFRVLDERAEKARDIETGAKEIAEARQGMEEWRAEQETQARAKTDAMLKEATEAAEARKREMLARAEEELAALKERTSRELAQERDRVFAEAQSELSGLALVAAERVLGREVSRTDTERLIQEALNELK
jgi:F-type H+-transporting ATPase subunit b